MAETRAYVIIPPGKPNNGTKGYLVIEEGQLAAWRKAHGDDPVNKGITCGSAAEAHKTREGILKMPETELLKRRVR